METRANSRCSASPGRTVRFQSDGEVVPYVSGFVYPTSGPNAGVVGGTHPLFEHVMLYRGYGVDDKIYQFRADLDIKGDNPNNGLADLRLGGYFSHDEKDTALYSNDGLAGCATCGYTIPAPTSIPIGVFNAGSNYLSGVSGANRTPAQWLTFSGPALFNAITQEQQAITPGFTFAPPLRNDSLVHGAGLRRLCGSRVRRKLARSTHHQRSGCACREYSIDRQWSVDPVHCADQAAH